MNKRMQRKFQLRIREWLAHKHKNYQPDAIKHHPLCHTWRGMIQRCYNPNVPNFVYYGGRGIKVCKPWLNDFYAYAKYVNKHLGPKPGPGYSLDRIDNDADYKPGNVRWATPAQQVNNQSPNGLLRKGARRLDFHGRILLDEMHDHGPIYWVVKVIKFRQSDRAWSGITALSDHYAVTQCFQNLTDARTRFEVLKAAYPASDTRNSQPLPKPVATSIGPGRMTGDHRNS